MFAMHRHEEAGPGQGQHQLFIFLGSVAGDMDAFAFAINHLGAKHHQAVDGVDHRNGVAGNRAGRKNDGVAAFDLNLGMVTAGNATQGRQRLALATSH